MKKESPVRKRFLKEASAVCKVREAWKIAFCGGFYELQGVHVQEGIVQFIEKISEQLTEGIWDSGSC